MLFNSTAFLFFFPIVVIIYYLIPGRFRYIWVLAASYYFYMQWNPIYILLLISSTLVTYIGGLILEKIRAKGARRICLVLALLINLGILGYFKYANMFMGYFNKFIVHFGRDEIPWDNSIILPVGISFFTLQALGYLIDVYRGDIYAEHNILKYALFISFFPQLVAGPIERSKNLLKQLYEPHKLEYDNVRRGLLTMLYGYFLKVAVADRLAILVDTVYGDPAAYPGLYTVLATVSFTFQVYCDFYGYSTIAKGAAKVMGINLMDNFNAPYLADSISEFWHRWHISLSTWFRDYLYIPLGGNRKGVLRKHLNLVIVFAVSGLWHGASLSFVLWGLIHGIYQVVEDNIRIIGRKLKGSRSDTGIVPHITKSLKIALNFALILFSNIFFRANSLSNAKVLLKQMILSPKTGTLPETGIFDLGLPMEMFIVMGFAILIIWAVDIYKTYKGDAVTAFLNRPWWLKTIAIAFLFVFIILFGCYGKVYNVKNFIYFQF